MTNFYKKIGVAEIKVETQDLSIGEEYKIIGDTTGVYEDMVPEIRVDEKRVEKTAKGDVCSIPVKELVRRGDKVYKVVEVTEDS